MLEKFMKGEAVGGNRGRIIQIFHVEEIITADVATECPNMRTPLLSTCFADLTKDLIGKFTQERHKSIGFLKKNNRKDWNQSFCIGKKFSAQRQKNVDQDRDEEMYPRRMAAHFAGFQNFVKGWK